MLVKGNPGLNILILIFINKRVIIWRNKVKRIYLGNVKNGWAEYWHISGADKHSLYMYNIDMDIFYISVFIDKSTGWIIRILIAGCQYRYQRFRLSMLMKSSMYNTINVLCPVIYFHVNIYRTKCPHKMLFCVNYIRHTICALVNIKALNWWYCRLTSVATA